MIPADDPDLAAHRAKFSFYYERALPLETTAMNALCFIHILLTLAIQGRREYLSAEVVAALNKLTDILEGEFMELTGIIRAGPAYRLLAESQREEMEAGCLSIEFKE
jgi:hypothetical protein